MTARQGAGRQRSSRVARRIGVVARSGACTASGSRVGLRQVAPRLTGCSASPRTDTSRPPPPGAARAPPPPQYGHVVRTSGKPHPDLVLLDPDLVDGDLLGP